jgi:thiaminase
MSDPTPGSADHVRQLVQLRLQEFLSHTYFAQCEDGSLPRPTVLKIVQQLYCMSTFFVRILTRRLSHFSSLTSPSLVSASREHLLDEIGHPEMFLRCLRDNGTSDGEIEAITPSCFLKALFGYLIATLEYEREQVVTVALFQVMETAALHYFTRTMELMQKLELHVEAVGEHVEADVGHADIGLEPDVLFDERTMNDIRRVTNDLFQLMEAALDEWLVRFRVPA